MGAEKAPLLRQVADRGILAGDQVAHHLEDAGDVVFGLAPRLVALQAKRGQGLEQLRQRLLVEEAGQVKGPDELRYEYPAELVPQGHTPISWLRVLTAQGAGERYQHRPDGVPASVLTQIERELLLVEELRYEAFFLTVHDVVRFARGKGILCQGRGSAANSAVCYCMGITEVDPTQTTLLFERFISRERDEPPDIDVDFEHERREEVIQYIYAKYGLERCARAAALSTYRSRGAVRDVGTEVRHFKAPPTPSFQS